MGWTGRAPAPDGTQSAPRACQEKEHHHASDVYGSRSDHHRNSEPLKATRRANFCLLRCGKTASQRACRSSAVLPSSARLARVSGRRNYRAIRLGADFRLLDVTPFHATDCRSRGACSAGVAGPARTSLVPRRAFGGF